MFDKHTPLLQKPLQRDIANYASRLHSRVRESGRPIACNKTSVLTVYQKLNRVAQVVKQKSA